MKKAKTQFKFFVLFLISLPVFSIAQTGDNKITNYKTVRIGNQEWMSENLNTTIFKNGDQVPEAKTNHEWQMAGKAGKPAWCYYDNDTVNGKKYGKLYNWFAVNDPRGLAPAGWHLPGDPEWATLTIFLGGEAVAGKKMKATTGWNDDGNGNNKSSFTGFPGGVRDPDGNFDGGGNYTYWWSTTEGSTGNAWDFGLNGGKVGISRGNDGKRNGLSVRCIKD